MTTRIMQQVSGTKRPLSFDAHGSNTLLHGSGSTPWAGVPFEVHRMVPTGEMHDAGALDAECGLVVFLEGSVDMVVRKGDLETTHRAVAGTTSFLAGERRSSVSRITGNAEVAAVNLPREWFYRLQLDGAPDGFGRLPPLAADETVRTLVNAMRRDVAGGAGSGRLYAESLSVALLSYLLERIPVSRLRVHGSLPEVQRRRLERFIRDRLPDDLTLTELASLVGLGPRQFSRIFRDTFGVAPHRYVLNQRLEEGARRLASSSDAVAEVALALGFSSQSHFATAFRKRFDRTPRQYAIEHRRRRRAFF